MKNILARGGIEFLAVFLGIALSLWVDDYRQEKELNNRIIDDYKNIYSEVKSNIKIIEKVISENNDIILSEGNILGILNRKVPYKQDNVIIRMYWKSFVFLDFLLLTCYSKICISLNKYFRFQ